MLLLDLQLLAIYVRIDIGIAIMEIYAKIVKLLVMVKDIVANVEHVVIPIFKHNAKIANTSYQVCYI